MSRNQRTKLYKKLCLPDLTRTFKCKRSRAAKWDGTILRQKFRCRAVWRPSYLAGQRPPDLLRRLHWLEEIIIVRPTVAFLPALQLYFSSQSSVFLPHKERGTAPLYYYSRQCTTVNILCFHSADINMWRTDLLFVNFWDRFDIVNEGKK